MRTSFHTKKYRNKGVDGSTKKECRSCLSFPRGISPMHAFPVAYVFNKFTPLSLCSHALAVTLPGFAGEECLPLPRSKGGAFPFLLTLGGCPTASANVAQGQRCSLESQRSPEKEPPLSLRLKVFPKPSALSSHLLFRGLLVSLRVLPH
jgi:hypothetical protein